MTLFAAQVGIMMWMLVVPVLLGGPSLIITFFLLSPTLTSLQRHIWNGLLCSDSTIITWNSVFVIPHLPTDTYGSPVLLLMRFWLCFHSGPLSGI